jgi:hypothetical protein
VDLCLVIKQRLQDLGLEQRDLAVAANVTESYIISQLLTRKKNASRVRPNRHLSKMAKFLKLPAGKLSEMADLQRKEQLKRNLGEPATPLLEEVRELILGKCAPDKEKQVRAGAFSSPRLLAGCGPAELAPLGLRDCRKLAGRARNRRRA